MATANSFGEQGLRFECQGTGKCCVSHNGYGFVFLNLEDRRRIAAHFGMKTREFTSRFCDRDKEGVWKLKDTGKPECPFLIGRKCGIYEARPMQCRTWPFWPEVMNARTWAKDVAAFCPGVGKGRTWTPDEIAAELQRQIRAEKGYGL